jgi:hypothetical protein
VTVAAARNAILPPVAESKGPAEKTERDLILQRVAAELRLAANAGVSPSMEGSDKNLVVVTRQRSLRFGRTNEHETKVVMEVGATVHEPRSSAAILLQPGGPH